MQAEAAEECRTELKAVAILLPTTLFPPNARAAVAAAGECPTARTLAILLPTTLLLPNARAAEVKACLTVLKAKAKAILRSSAEEAATAEVCRLELKEGLTLQPRNTSNTSNTRSSSSSSSITPLQDNTLMAEDLLMAPPNIPCPTPPKTRLLLQEIPTLMPKRFCFA